MKSAGYSAAVMLGACGRIAFDEPPLPDAPPNVSDDQLIVDCASAVFAQPAADSITDAFTNGFGPGWAEFNEPACAAVMGGELVTTPRPNTDNDYCLLNSQRVHLTCSSFAFHVTELPTSQVGMQAVFYAFTDPSSSDFPLVLLAEAGTFILDSAFVPYEPALDGWWRIRETGGTTIIETAPDGLTWRERFRRSTPRPMHDVQLSLGAGEYELTPTPGRARFDCVNLVTGC